MTARIDRLVAVLDAAGVRLTPAELAEAIWLGLRVDMSTLSPAPAARAPLPGPPPGPVLSPPPDPDRMELRLPVHDGDTPQPGAPQGAGRVTDGATGGDGDGPAAPHGPAAPVDALGGGTGGTDPDEVRGRPLLVRTAGALPGSGQVMRALRPLKRRVRTGQRVTLDEEATARQVAELGLWTPVWQPALSRWLHLTLVLDRTSVDGVWTRLGHEVRVLLERLGAFRTMRVVQLGLCDDGTPGVMRRGRAGPGSLDRLADRSGDHLLLVLSDCVSGPWHDGEMSRLLGHWARRGPVAVLQPLPERLWSRTGLDPLPGLLSSPGAGAPAARYGFRSAWRRRQLPERSVPVPVLQIDPAWLRSWADLVAGRAVGYIDAIVAAASDSGRVPVPSPSAGGPVSADRRVRDFRAVASAPAYQLARYLSAAVPLNLGVMRVVQAVTVPRSWPSHLAEVLYSGLLAPVSLDGGNSDEQHFEFHPGVRQALMGTLHQVEASRVLLEVSRYVEEHLERAGASFTAVMAAPVGSLTVPALRQPFAQIRADVLRRLAGRAVRAGEPEPAEPRQPAGGHPAGGAPPGAGARTSRRLTVLHVTDLRDAGGSGGVGADLVVVTGGLARRATPAEYQAAYQMLEDLRTGAGLPAGRVVVVPGVADVNEGRCLAHFMDRAADGEEPVPPYWPKWEPFAELTARLPGATPFQTHQPWQLLEVPDRRAVVAALNSTMAVSHLPGERFGRLGDAQLRWFADVLSDYERRGWLRVGVLHHDPTRDDGATGLRDADAFVRLLAPQLDVVLHGQPGGVHEINLTGVPAVGAAGRHQVVELRPGTLRVAPPAGDGVPHAYGDHWWLGTGGPDPDPMDGGDADLVDGSRTDLVARVAQAYRARVPGTLVAEHRWPGAHPGGPMAGYLTATRPGGQYTVPHCIGVFDGEPTADTVQRFLDDVVRPEGLDRDATLVCRSVPADAGLPEDARGQGVRLTGFADFQLGDDVRRYAEGLAAALAVNPAYPSAFYIPQPHVVLGADSDGTPLIDRLRAWLAAPEGQMIAVLGASGTGKTFLLRELARRLVADRDPVVPILVDPADLDWRTGLDELVAIHLSRGGVRQVDLDRSRHLLREGRVALLCDGLDDLAGRAAHEPLRTWVSGWESDARTGLGRGKVVLVSRDADLLADAFQPYAAGQPGGVAARWVQLVGLEREDILEFLTRRFGPDRARARMELLGQVGGLLGMAHNPRMLAFIADLDDDRLRAAASGSGRVTVAALYRQLITGWLDGERRRGGAGKVLGQRPLDDLGRAVRYLARRLWESGEPALGADAIGAAADVLTRLTIARGDEAPGRRETARLLGTLLVRDQAYRFQFVDRSVLEWLVASEIAEQLDQDRRTGRLRRDMSPLMVEFVCDLAGPGTAGRWARSVLADATLPAEVRANARRVLDHLLRHDTAPGSEAPAGSPEPPAGWDGS